MKLSRKQKRWMRMHKVLIRICVLLAVVVIAALVYVGLLLAGTVEVPKFLQGTIEFPTFSPNGNTEQSTKTGKDEEKNTGAANPIVLTAPTEAPTEKYTVPQQAEFPYYIKVNRIMNCVTIYGMDDSGQYSIPVKAMICSVGKNDGDTPLDISKTSDKYEFHPMVDGSYGQYAYRFNVGGILFHSVPYFSRDKSDLETEQFNLLGSAASLGCVRLCVRDALWLLENCPSGTTVEVYDDTTTPGPLGKPEMIKIPLDSPYAGWDPTDPDVKNPWHQFGAAIQGAEDVTISVGADFDPAAGVTATDTCGNDITEKLVITGTYDCNTTGKYTLTYRVKDAIDSEASVTIILSVE